MKQSNIIHLVLALGIVILFVLHFTQRPSESTDFAPQTADSSGVVARLPIAYVNVDSLLLHYNYSIDLNEVLLRKRENAQATLNQKMRQLETDMAEFQRKHENNAFLSEQSFKSQQQGLIKKQQDLQKLEESLAQELMQEQQSMNNLLRDSIYRFLETYNQKKNYHLILSNTLNDNVLLAHPMYDITSDIIELLNAQYVPIEK
ncbi:MAG: OmpH family outer membrane protein [Bacteroidales bacterium]|nr:OmpH family outer membrane protein [Bacteroidales bacterium]MDD3166950.1 OmpH family outer membrane protein [Bacteroidales bacterium]MDD4771664.1 OmpH family outer membrane protein [Bacteroidales bacterium]